VRTKILAIVEDLLFLSKIQTTAKVLGITINPVDPAQLLAQIVEVAPQGVLLDLNLRSVSAIELIRSLKAHSELKQITVVGFVSHVQGDLIATAREAGCDIVMARSAFSQQLPQLLRKLGAEHSKDNDQ
jgi:DNA-binding NarL/FixJ family response regulator